MTLKRNNSLDVFKECLHNRSRIISWNNCNLNRSSIKRTDECNQLGLKEGRVKLTESFVSLY